MLNHNQWKNPLTLFQIITSSKKGSTGFSIGLGWNIISIEIGTKLVAIVDNGCFLRYFLYQISTQMTERTTWYTTSFLENHIIPVWFASCAHLRSLSS